MKKNKSMTIRIDDRFIKLMKEVKALALEYDDIDLSSTQVIYTAVSYLKNRYLYMKEQRGKND